MAVQNDEHQLLLLSEKIKPNEAVTFAIHYMDLQKYEVDRAVQEANQFGWNAAFSIMMAWRRKNPDVSHMFIENKLTNYRRKQVICKLIKYFMVILIIVIPLLCLYPNWQHEISPWVHEAPFNCTVRLPDGCDYRGCSENNKRSGSGVLRCQNGTSYDGQWHLDAPHGTGKMVYANGVEYNGQWKNGKRSGHGTCIWPKLVTSETQCPEDRWRRGPCFLAFDAGSSYTGKWKQDLPHGTGTMTYGDGKEYRGSWENGERSGYGTCTWPDGRKYNGWWRYDHMNGKGLLKYSDGSQYDGELQLGMAFGYGTLKSSDGTSHEGQWEHNLKHGKVKTTSPNGVVYDGNWLYNVQNGFGIYTWPDGKTIKAMFKNGELQGICRTTGKGGELYNGTCLDGQWHGYGIIVTRPDKCIYEGALINSTKFGQGTMTCPHLPYTVIVEWENREVISQKYKLNGSNEILTSEELFWGKDFRYQKYLLYVIFLVIFLSILAFCWWATYEVYVWNMCYIRLVLYCNKQ